jgi:putative redox protein
MQTRVHESRSDRNDGTVVSDAEHDYVVVQTGTRQYHTEIWARGHAFLSDEPESKGGANEGPTPYDLLLASLGSCTSITLRMYADRKGWPLERIDVRLWHDRVHAEDCDECEEETGWIDRIYRDLEVSGDLTDQQRQRLLYIADRCPVHKALKGPIVVKTRLKGVAPTGPDPCRD